MDRSADETPEEETLYYGLLKKLKNTTDTTTARLTLQAIVADFALPGLKPSCRPKEPHCRPKKHRGSGPAMPADLEAAGTRERWIRAASADSELPCGLTRAAAGWSRGLLDMRNRHDKIQITKHVRPPILTCSPFGGC